MRGPDVLHVHRAGRADLLVEALAAVIADPLPDPLTPEVVSVPTRGVERWLTQKLSTVLGVSPGRQDGVCANIEFPFPARLVDAAVAVSSGIDPDADPWAPERSVWPLLDVVESCLAEPWLAPLAAHLGAEAGADEHSRSRRFAVVRHLADLFDKYGVHRPELIQEWAAGGAARGSGAGSPLPADLAWQARLWRGLRERIGVASPAERLREACRRLREDPGVLQAPGRLSLFGLTRLPGSHRDVLAALAAARDVHLFLLHPSPALWAKVASCSPARAPTRRREDPTARLPANPLLATWGRDARELQVVLHAAGERVDHDYPVPGEPATLLARLQQDIREDREPPGEPLPGAPDSRLVLAAGDRSVEVHACHGRARQVEVLRDAILQLLADDLTLEPRDVIVMCPDIETFAPLVEATFGSPGAEAGDDDGDEWVEGTGAPDLRVRLADRALRQTNPVLGVVSELLRLAGARLTASEAVDLAGREPVRRRFGFDDDDLARVEQWVTATGIRWGLDAAHRAPFKLGDLPTGTWAAGLDRLLLGVTMDERGQRLVGGVLPLDDLDSRDIDLAGRLAEFVDRLGGAVRALGRTQPLGPWVEALAAAADALTATGAGEEWQRAELARLLDGVLAEAGCQGGAQPPVGAGIELSPAEMGALLGHRLRGRPTRANFRTGHLTVCTLVPMRSVPHRVVCLLGLDDEAFPRRTAPDGDDLVQRDPCVGDRDPRSEDRQLLLDALLAARDHLVVTYTGRDERTNAPRPPAVPLGELLDVIDATARLAGGQDGDRPGPAREHVRVEHPLQPFDARNFAPGALVGGRPWSFDRVALEGARAASGRRSPPRPFLAGPLPPPQGDLVELDDLVQFVQHPVKAFLRQRLGIVVTGRDDTSEDALPLELDPLQEWHVGQRLLEARLAGADADACRAAEAARGLLPPGELGTRVLAPIAQVVERIVEQAARIVGSTQAPSSVEVNLDVGDAVLAGTVTGLYGEVIRAVSYSRVGAKQRMAAWVRLLALAAACPERRWETATVGRGSGLRVTVATVPPLGGSDAEQRDEALRHLAEIVDLYQRGMCEPLPLYCRTSAAYAQGHAAGRDPLRGAARVWVSEWRDGRFYAGEDADQEHRLVLGGQRPFGHLLQAVPRPDEHGEGWAGGERTRFGRYARRLWDPLLAKEQVSSR